jgi:hypothetical protein
MQEIITQSLIILAVNFLFYAKTLKFEYVSDDVPSSQRPKEKGWIQWFWVFEGKLKSTPRIDHAITTVLHSLVCVGIYLGFGSNDISFLAALLFSFNPINNQGSVWISGRGYVLSALGMVWALVLPMEMGGLMLLGATYSNAGFLLPVILLGSSHPYLFIFAPLVWLYHWKRFKTNVGAKMTMELLPEDREWHPRKFMLVIKTFGIYLSHAIIPIKTTFYHSYLESIAGCKKANAYTPCKFFWFGTASILLMAWYVIFHKWDIICFGVLWWCVGISPFVNLYRMQQELGERYVYVANIGLMLILAFYIHNNPYLVAGFLMMYATKMWFFMDGYQNDFWMVEFARMHQPKSWFAWHIAAMKRWEKQSYTEAVIFWVIARSLSPKEFKLLYNLASSLMMLNNKKEAMELLAQAKTNIPRGQEKACGEIIKNFEEGKVTILM